MVRLLVVVMAVATFGAVLCKPLEEAKDFRSDAIADQKVHLLWKRFINTALTSGNFFNEGLSKIRTRRSVEEDCEKLELCRLHARSGHSFLAAYELYFVNRENSRLWDHQTHTVADCDRRFAHCFGGSAPAAPARKNNAYKNDDYDYSY